MIVMEEIKDDVDFSYFCLTNDGFKRVLPILQMNHFPTVKRLNVAGNSLNDESIIQLCDSLTSIHN